MPEDEEKPKLTKAEENIKMTMERRARKSADAKRRPADVEKSRTRQVQVVSARKDPELRAKQLQDKEDEEKSRVERIEKERLANRKRLRLDEPKVLTEAEVEAKIKQFKNDHSADSLKALAESLELSTDGTKSDIALRIIHHDYDMAGE